MGIQASNNLPSQVKRRLMALDFDFRESYITPFNVSVGFQ